MPHEKGTTQGEADHGRFLDHEQDRSYASPPASPVPITHHHSPVCPPVPPLPPHLALRVASGLAATRDLNSGSMPGPMNPRLSR